MIYNLYEYAEGIYEYYEDEGVLIDNLEVDVRDCIDQMDIDLTLNQYEEMIENLIDEVYHFIN